MNIPGGWELTVIVLILLLLFGAKRIPKMAKSLVETMWETKKALRRISEDEEA